MNQSLIRIWKRWMKIPSTYALQYLFIFYRKSLLCSLNNKLPISIHSNNKKISIFSYKGIFWSMLRTHYKYLRLFSWYKSKYAKLSRKIKREIVDVYCMLFNLIHDNHWWDDIIIQRKYIAIEYYRKYYVHEKR